jgi:hypothetical protein
MNARAASIAQALLAMRRLGIDFVIDFSVKCGVPDFMLEHTMQASLLMGQDKFTLSLPVVLAKEGSLPILDHKTTIRTDPIPVVEPEGLDEHTVESLPESCEEDFDPEIDLVLAEQVMRKTYEEGHGIDIEGWGI